METYEIAKDFAGPSATVCASIAALIFSYKFSSRQATLAERQADTAREQAATALDQLRWNLFGKRYEIYQKTAALIALCINKAGDERFSPFETLTYKNALDEARFFFSEDLCTWLKQVWEDVEDCMKARLEREGDIFTRSQHKLLKRLEELPQAFGAEMTFSQLKQVAGYSLVGNSRNEQRSRS